MSPILCQGIVYMCVQGIVYVCVHGCTCVPAFNIMGSLQLCFILYLLPMQSINVNQKYKIWTYSVSPMYTPWDVCGFLVPQEYFRAFQSLLWTYYFPDFPFKFFG